MGDVPVATSSGPSVMLNDSAIDGLASALQGTLIKQGDGAFDETRAIWNAMVDKKPALIAQCATTTDIVTAVNFAREHGLLVGVSGSGHNIAGKAVWDDALMIDLGEQRELRPQLIELGAVARRRVQQLER